MLLAYERIIVLPLDLAIVYSLEQNFRLDVQRGIISGFDRWQDEKPSYHREALELLREQGCNYYPGNNDEPWFHVCTQKDPAVHTLISQHLIEVVDFICLQTAVGKEPKVQVPPPQHAADPTFIVQAFSQMKRRNEQFRIAAMH